MSNFFSKRAKEAKKNNKDKPDKKVLEIEVDKLLEAAIEVAEEKVLDKEPEVVVESKVEVKKEMHKAHNTYYDSVLKKFMLVVIEYDVVTGYSKITEVKPIADSWAVALGKVNDILALKLARGEEKV